MGSDIPNIRPAFVASDGLPAAGFIRLAQLIGPNGPIPFSKSTLWAGIRAGRFPAPVKLGPRISAWRVEDVRAYLRRAGGEEG